MSETKEKLEDEGKAEVAEENTQEDKEEKKLTKGMHPSLESDVGQKKKEKQKKKKKKDEDTQPVSRMALLAAEKAAKHKEEAERRQKEEEERRRQEEEERLRLELEEKKRKEEQEARVALLRAEYQEKRMQGLILTEAEKRRKEKMDLQRQEMAEALAKQHQEPTAHTKKKRKKGAAKVETPKPSEEKKEEPSEEKKEQPSAKEETKEASTVDLANEDWEQLADNPAALNAALARKLSVDEREELQKGLSPGSQSSDPSKPSVGAVPTVTSPTTKPKTAEDEKLSRPKETKKEGKKERSEYRSPILCVLGHVDTGKTKLLDKIRRTKVQEGEVGGITQQIGATFFPRETLAEHAAKMKSQSALEINIPGLLIIDTPGHESFSNLRNRGSSLCDFAILLVDLMHGLENQTVESIMILKKRRIPFLVALNKIDRCYGWKEQPYASSKESYERNRQCHQQFTNLANKVIAQFAEHDINACLYWNNAEPETFTSLVPTSAITGEGIPDILTAVVEQIQTRLEKKIIYSDRFVCTIMEVKITEGYGVTCDVILVTGELHVDDVIVLGGIEGPIVTNIRALLTPQPLKEMRVKGEYIHHSAVRGTMGVKLCAPGLESALAGSPILRPSSPEEVEKCKSDVGEELALIIKKYLNPRGEGVCVQSSTLGSLEALLELLKNAGIPVANIALGPIHKRHILKVMKAIERKEDREEYATILAFEVAPEKEAKDLAEEMGIRIFTASIVYHLVDMYKKHAEECVYAMSSFLDTSGNSPRARPPSSPACSRSSTPRPSSTTRTPSSSASTSSLASCASALLSAFPIKKYSPPSLLLEPLHRQCRKH